VSASNLAILSEDWHHQAHEFKIGKDKRSRALIWPMRSGKSRACLKKAEYNYKLNRIEGVVIVAPNGVHINWVHTEIPKWITVEHEAVAWSTPLRGDPDRIAAFNEMCEFRGLKFFAVNMEALKHLDNRRDVRKFIMSCHRKFMLIVSEAHHFGRAGAKRTYFARSLAKNAAFVQTETGTPILTGPLHAFSQYELISEGALGFTDYTSFKKHYAEFEPSRPGSRHKYEKVARYINLDELRSRIARWTSVVLREDIHDMPALVRTERPVVMSDACRRQYLDMVARFTAEIGDDVLKVPDAGPRMMKLQQILHGYVLDTTANKILSIDDEAPIYDALMDEIEGTLPGKVLVWCRYREDIKRVMRRLNSRGWKFLEYHGGYSQIEREKNRRRFLIDEKIDGIVGTPDTGGEGLDFSAADAEIFFSIPPNARMISQAEERATVKGGKSVSIVRLRHYGTVDDRMWQIVDGNVTLADTITGRGLRDLLMNTDI